MKIFSRNSTRFYTLQYYSNRFLGNLAVGKQTLENIFEIREITVDANWSAGSNDGNCSITWFPDQIFGKRFGLDIIEMTPGTSSGDPDRQAAVCDNRV